MLKIQYQRKSHIARLTVTWDVFKYIENMSIREEADRLTVTWDVFK